MKLSDSKIEDIKKMLGEGFSHREIARSLGISKATVSRYRNLEPEKEIPPEEKFKAFTAAKKEREKLKDIKGQYNVAIKEIETLIKQLSIYSTGEEYLRHFNPIDIKPKSGGRGEAIAMLSVGDWHLDEVVDKDAVNGLNEFNPEICDRRIKELWSTGASLLDMCRSRSKIDTIVVSILGDLITGWIHEPFLPTNSMTPPEAVLKAFDYLISGLSFLVRETKVKKIFVVPVCGNHGRTTIRPYNKLLVQTSYEWMIYRLLAKWFDARKDQVIEFKLPQGYMNYIKIYDNLIRFHHGDNIRYQGGIGGVHIPLRKAIDRWNTGKRADYNISGHWHSYRWGEDYLLNGSLIGYNEFSIRIKATYEKPSQSFFLFHPRYGPTAHFPIILDV